MTFVPFVHRVWNRIASTPPEMLTAQLPPKSRTRPRLPDGIRIYAISDIHGCAHLLEQMFRVIDADVPIRRRIARSRCISATISTADRTLSSDAGGIAYRPSRRRQYGFSEGNTRLPRRVFAIPRACRLVSGRRPTDHDVLRSAPQPTGAKAVPAESVRAMPPHIAIERPAPELH